MQQRTDVSYGIIPISYQAGEWQVFLIRQYSHIGDNAYWALPKGHPEADEAPVAAAVRELVEETGLIAANVTTEPSFQVQYSFEFGGEAVHKTVTFFIGVITNTAYVLDENEVREGGWYSLAAALERLDYPATKQMFAEAITYIETLKP